MPTDSFLDNLLLRSTTRPNIAAKGDTLLYAEEDRNFWEIAEFLYLLAYAAIAGLPAYVSGDIYSGGVSYKVSYSGAAWEFISATNKTGIAPGTDSAIWRKMAISEFAHVQGSDTELTMPDGSKLTAVAIAAGNAGNGPFSAIRTTNTAIGLNETRIQYKSEAVDITPTMPSPVDGKVMYWYNRSLSKMVTLGNVLQSDETVSTHEIYPGGWVCLVGDGTNWRYNN